MSGDVRVEVCPIGPALLEALTRHIAEAQRDDALAAVTIVAPSRTSALGWRRAIAARTGALIGVRFEVLPRVAELVAAPLLAQRARTPLRPAMRAEAIRAVLRRDPGMLAAVADHPATVGALRRTLDDLAGVPAAALDALRGPRAWDLRRLLAQTHALQGARYDRNELLWTAAEAIEQGTVPIARELGRVVVVLTDVPSAAEAALLRALTGSGGAVVLVAVTGEPGLDQPLRDATTAISGGAMTATQGTMTAAQGVASTSGEPPPGQGPPAHRPVDRVLSAPDPDGEVRAAVRLLAARFHDGVPLYRMALWWTARRPYALLVRDALAAAGVPASGLPRPALAQSPTGRALLGALALGGRRLERDQVMQWLAAAPIRGEAGGAEVDGARWDAVSRRAGVVRDLPQWQDRLHRYAYDQRTRAEAARRDDDAGRARHHELEAEHAGELARFVTDLAGGLRPPRGGWAACAAWALELLDRYVGSPRVTWTDDEVDADRAVRQALRALGELDALGTACDLDAFRRAAEAELQTPFGAHPPMTGGLVVGDLGRGVGLDFDVVVVVGLAEGFAPPAVREDPLLPDRLRRAVPGLPLAADRPASVRRALHWALAASGERVLCAPRSDPRGGRERLPSRWLLEEAGRLEGRPVHSQDLEALRGRPWLHWLASFPQSLREPPAGESELRLARLVTLAASRRDDATGRRATLTARASAGELDEAAARGELTGSPGDARLVRGLAALHDRRYARFGPWTGLVGPRPAVALGPRPLSPTRLEAWATCPFRYYLERVLDLEALARPEDIVRIDPRERGRLVHRILERFLTEAAAPQPGEPWPDERRARLHAIAAEECERWERQGVTGKALLWRLERTRLARELDAFLDDETKLRARWGTMPSQVEQSFGFDGPRPGLPAATLPGHEVPRRDGVSFRGFVDRIDRTPDGSTVVVVDYKTGRPEPYRKALGADAIGAGQLLQLPVYALAAEALAADAGQAGAGVQVHAAYWFLTEDGIVPVDWDASALPRFQQAVRVIVDGVEAGQFAQRAGRSALRAGTTCDRCDFELVCDRDRERRWQELRLLPQLAGLRQLEDTAFGEGGDD